MDILVNICPKINWKESMTEDVHTIQDLKSGLFHSLYLQGTLYVFNSRKPTESDMKGGKPVCHHPLTKTLGICNVNNLRIMKHSLPTIGEKFSVKICWRVTNPHALI